MNNDITPAGLVRVGDSLSLDDGTTFHITGWGDDGDNVELDGWREWDGGNADHIVNLPKSEEVKILLVLDKERGV